MFGNMQTAQYDLLNRNITDEDTDTEIEAKSEASECHTF